jgi:hypothetical protein
MVDGGETRDPFTKKEEHKGEREQEATNNHCRNSPIDLAQRFLEVSRYPQGKYCMNILSGAGPRLKQQSTKAKRSPNIRPSLASTRNSYGEALFHPESTEFPFEIQANSSWTYVDRVRIIVAVAGQPGKLTRE